MTIKNFTFFSPNGTEFPVGSNNDGKLYMMLTGMDYGTIRRKDWSNPLNTALNVQYTNTSIIAGGRYFELLNETVALKANSVNYIHANIDLTQTTNPVSLSAETVNNSNNVDLNNNSGVLKVLIDIRTTDGTGVISAKVPDNVTYLDKLVVNSIKIGNMPIFPSYSDGQWTVEQIQENLYRLTAFVTSNAEIGATVGSLKMGPNISNPALPIGFAEVHSSVCIAEASRNCWVMRDGSGARIVAPLTQRAANNTVKFEVLATKTL